MKLAKGCAAVLVPVLLVVAVSAAAETPLPQAGNVSVHDLAGVIAPDRSAAMEQRHRRLLAATGVAIAVLTVPRLQGETIEELAVRAGQTWGVGQRGKDRGIVIALAVADQRIFVATGYGVEGFLPDGRVGAILDAVAVPYLRRHDFSTALDNLSIALTEASAEALGADLGQRERPRPAPDRPPGGAFGNVIGVLIGLVFLWLLFRHPGLLLAILLSGGRRGGGFGGGFGGGGGGGFGGFGGGGFGGGGAGRGF